MSSKLRVISSGALCGILACALVFSTRPVQASVFGNLNLGGLGTTVNYQPPQWWGQAAAWAAGGAVAGAKGGWVAAGLGALGGFVGYAAGQFAADHAGVAGSSEPPLTALD